MKSIFHGAGYFMNDDRASGGKLDEADFGVCNHCQVGLKLQEWRKNGGQCFVCTAPICHTCYRRTAKFGCEVFERKLENALNSAYRRQQNAKLMGI